jgi:hypothetical protein
VRRSAFWQAVENSPLENSPLAPPRRAAPTKRARKRLIGRWPIRAYTPIGDMKTTTKVLFQNLLEPVQNLLQYNPKTSV